MKKFNYKTFNEKLSEGYLNMLGEEGWELISHTAVANQKCFAQYYIFKKEIQIDHSDKL